MVFDIYYPEPYLALICVRQQIGHWSRNQELHNQRKQTTPVLQEAGLLRDANE